jgi:hypothetical protein
MSLRDTKAEPKRLPGRAYTLLVTSLATLLMALPLMRPSTAIWNLTAIVNHPEIQDPETAEQIARDHLQSAGESIGILSGEQSETKLAALQSKLMTTSEASGDGRFTTTIQFHHGDQHQAREVVGQIADALAETAAAGGVEAQVVSIEAQAAGGIPRGKLFAVMMCSFTVGITTIFFPRRRARPTESHADKLEQVTNATGLPVIGSVLSTSSKKVKKKPSNFPLRLTAFGAELVVASAFLFTVYAAASDTARLTQMVQSPLDGYAQSIRTAGEQFQSVLQR